MAQERLQKVLARAGVASRRAAENLITQGRVKVDGRVVSELGVRVDPRRSRIDLDGKRIVAEPLVYVMLHKPRGVMCTLSDPEGRKTVVDLLKGVGVRVVPVGRLDYHTSGALLCTNDGDFADKLLHPSGGVPKEYVAKVHGLLDEDSLEKWSQSIEIDGRATRPAEVRLLRHEGDKSWITLILHEGRNRQVRRLGEATGFPVLRLARVAHAGITTEGLRPGQWRHLSRDELIDLKKAYGVPRVVHGADPEALARRTTPRPKSRPDTLKGEQRAGHAPRKPGRNASTGERRSAPAHGRNAPTATGRNASAHGRNAPTATGRSASAHDRGAPMASGRGASARPRDGRGPSRPRGTSR